LFSKIIRSWIALFLLICSGSAIAAESLILTAPPRESAAAGQKLYGPLAKALSNLLGQPVTYVHPKTWISYSIDMRKGKYDIVFDGPQFESWRIAHQNAVPLARLPGFLQFYVAVSDPKITSMEQLIAKRVCAISSPNLTSLVVLDQFRDPARQPIMVNVKGGMPGIYKAQTSGKCVAAIYRTNFYNGHLTDDQKQGLHILFTSAKIPNQGFSAGSKLSQAQVSKLSDYMLSGKSDPVLMPIVKRFSKNATGLIGANAAEYKGYNALLEDNVWGWSPNPIWEHLADPGKSPQKAQQ
jgi:ABC-type phosphate/phosphonate transport system substrate-binding protein